MSAIGGTDRRGGGSTSVISNRENSLAPRRHSRASFFSRFLAAVVVVVDARSSRIIVRAKTLFRFLRLPLDPLAPPPPRGAPPVIVFAHRENLRAGPFRAIFSERLFIRAAPAARRSSGQRTHLGERRRREDASRSRGARACGL